MRGVDEFQEKWVDTKTGKPCGRQKGEKRKGYPSSDHLDVCHLKHLRLQVRCRVAKRLSSTDLNKFYNHANDNVLD